MDDVKSLVRDSVELASLPAVVYRALELLDDVQASASGIGRVIGEDPALTARLLKIVNSAFYGFPSRIDTISRAITIIGTQELTDLILGTSTIDAFSKFPNRLINMQRFWEHSLYTGVVSRILARRMHRPGAERYFVMGLLHDIGTLVLYRKQPDLACRALQLATESTLPLELAEVEVFGFHHGTVGAELMQAWKVPATFAEVSLHHHQPSAAERYPLETITVHLADIITCMSHGTASDTGESAVLEPGAWELAGLSADILESVIGEADACFAEASAALLPRTGVA
ncbi:MAG: HDOD domain-containing protein [Thiogranum sp.]|nr:HDOD domain-containing protein [Thiogranum sp.]